MALIRWLFSVINLLYSVKLYYVLIKGRISVILAECNFIPNFACNSFSETTGYKFWTTWASFKGRGLNLGGRRALPWRRTHPVFVNKLPRTVWWRSVLIVGGSCTVGVKSPPWHSRVPIALENGQILIKLNTYMPYDLDMPAFTACLRNTKIYVHKGTWTGVFLIA